MKSTNVCLMFILSLCIINRFVNLGFDHYCTEIPETALVRMEVLTNRIGNTLALIKAA